MTKKYSRAMQKLRRILGTPNAHKMEHGRSVQRFTEQLEAINKATDSFIEHVEDAHRATDNSKQVFDLPPVRGWNEDVGSSGTKT